MLIKHGSLCSVLTTVLITFFLCTLTDRVQASSSERSCIINNIIDGGTVTYIFCRDGSTDEWLMTPRISVSIGEQIFFDDAPALTNFESRHIKYTFPKIISTNVRKSVERKTSFKQVLNLAGPHESTETSRSKDDTTYVGADDNGTLVFSDDPAKV
ncbi:MAG: hypothetical protein FIA99_08385, partial [Ruminiclostridium sp.]|nr:hypothetical protein [Ruminiclostridium sp.]